MEENETVQVVLDLDLESAEKSLQSFMEGMESLQDLAKNIGAELRKAFAPLQATLQKSVLSVDSLTDALSEASSAMQTLMDQMASEQIADQWLGGISAATEGLSLFASVIEPAKKAIGSLAKIIGENVNIAAIGSWFVGLGKSILKVIGTMDAKAAIVIAVVTAVIAGIAAMIANWDKITGAMATFFANTLPQLRDQFTQWIAGIGAVLAEMASKIMEMVAPIVTWFSTLIGSIFQTVSDVVYNIGVVIRGGWEIVKAIWGSVAAWFKATVVDPVSNFLTGMWEGFLNAAKAAWEGVKSVFGNVAQFFRDAFSAAWAGVVKVFSVAGDIFTNIKDGILAAFKVIVNGIITGINSAIKIPFDGINSALQTVRNVRIFELTPFAGLRSIHVPQIPYLAKGAVLPANRPFLAMVGDQRHGTNIEAPLSTIQEAMALTMEDFMASNMAGHEATVGVLKEILEAVLGIHIGDADIGKAVQRYQRKMAVVNGRRY